MNTQAILSVFFPPDLGLHSFSRTGVNITVDGEVRNIRGDFCCYVADERALKEVCSCKGSGGVKPCCWCQNMVKKPSPSDGLQSIWFGFYVLATQPHSIVGQKTSNEGGAE